MIQALESTESNFAGMESQFDKSMVENKEYWAQFPTLQDMLIVI
jgi:hypothetical protein